MRLIQETQCINANVFGSVLMLQSNNNVTVDKEECFLSPVHAAGSDGNRPDAF